jgi:aryl-alcohol dehydrogenase-like predicted oxidoreductase
MDRFAFDTVLMPINPAEPHYRSFLHEALPVARDKGLGIIGMKVYLRGFATRVPWLSSLEPLFRFALSQQIATAVIGCDSVHQLEENVRFAERFTVMGKEEQTRLVDEFAPLARQLLYYKP